MISYVGQSYSSVGRSPIHSGRTNNKPHCHLITSDMQNVRWFPLYVGQFHEWVGQCPWPTDILRPARCFLLIYDMFFQQIFPTCSWTAEVATSCSWNFTAHICRSMLKILTHSFKFSSHRVHELASTLKFGRNLRLRRWQPNINVGLM
jgi:hypothetical protein